MPAGVDHITVESADGTWIHVSVFPASDPVAALFVVHGLRGHAGWLEASGTGLWLAAQGILTLAYDRRGSGRSAGERGHADSWRDFLDDLTAARDLLRRELIGRRNPRAPVHALANGFGVKVALPFLLENPGAFDSVILAAPETRVRHGAGYSLRDRLRILAAPDSHRFPTPGAEEDLVGGGVWLDWLRDDERSLRACTASFLRAAAQLSVRTRQAIGRLTQPMLVLTAERDALVRSDAIERGLRSRYRGPLRLRRLPGEHCMDFTAAQADLRAALAAWILGGWAAP